MKNIIGFLLHHANRTNFRQTHVGTKEQFYAIKRGLIQRHGAFSGECDYQLIHGKVCFQCNGTGKEWNWNQDEEDCDYCGGDGWWLNPKIVVLGKFTIGKYSFHQPVVSYRNYNEGFVEFSQKVNITGFISHTPSKLSIYCLLVLFIIYCYDPHFTKRLIIQQFPFFRHILARRKAKEEEEQDNDLPF